MANLAFTPTLYSFGLEEKTRFFYFLKAFPADDPDLRVKPDMSLSLTLDRTYRYCCCFKKTRVMIPCVFFSSSDDNTMLHYCSRQKLGLFFGGGEKYPKSPLSPEDLQQRIEGDYKLHKPRVRWQRDGPDLQGLEEDGDSSSVDGGGGPPFRPRSLQAGVRAVLQAHLRVDHGPSRSDRIVREAGQGLGRVKELFDSRLHISAWCQDILARPAWAKVVEMQKK
ncbi:hypothetical protein MRB53_029126 [Persea americana]|uniref:Uncharacterized protein n=1 Tax=Persea americana TaxID=3435 RepID=A0ACC2KHW1_PERAE|nr:hypothetical protein MRB53_029126 [Persea americana]